MSQIVRDAAASDLEVAAGEDLLVKNGELLFKVVAVGYAGAADWVARIHAALPAEARGELAVTDHDAWRMASCNFPLAGIEVHDHPVRVHLFGHEGLGFLGQPGTSKDAVYKRASAILGLADATDIGDLIGVLAADLARHRGSGGRPLCLVVGPEGSASPDRPFEGARRLRIDWRARPRELLDHVMEHVLAAARAHRPPGAPAAPAAPPPASPPPATPAPTGGGKSAAAPTARAAPTPPAASAPEAVAGAETGAANDVAARLVTMNFERAYFTTLTEPWEILVSPIWERGPKGNAVRRAFLTTRSMRAHYFEGAAAELLRRPDLGDIVMEMAARRNGDDPDHPQADLRALYCDPDAPYIEIDEPWTPALGGLSLIIADAARRARVGATPEQLRANQLRPGQSAELDAIEQSFRNAVSRAPIDELERALLDLAGPDGGPRPPGPLPASDPPRKPGKPWWKIW